jgi:hypothetical protein
MVRDDAGCQVRAVVFCRRIHHRRGDQFFGARDVALQVALASSP